MDKDNGRSPPGHVHSPLVYLAGSGPESTFSLQWGGNASPSPAAVYISLHYTASSGPSPAVSTRHWVEASAGGARQDGHWQPGFLPARPKMLYRDSLDSGNPFRQQIRRYYRADEAEIIGELLPLADTGDAVRSRIRERARELIRRIRREQSGRGGVDALLQEFALSTEEGVVLMCLAEALLRVPDRLTVDRLIRDKLSAGDWSAHLGHSDSLFVSASAWGLLLTGRMVHFSEKEGRGHFGLLRRTIGRLGEPVIRAAVRHAMQIMGTQFVLGRTIDGAVARARAWEAAGCRFSYDMLGEGARTMADANRHFEAYLNAIEVIGRVAGGRGPEESPGVSVKLSAIHPRCEFAQRERVISELVPRLRALALAAKQHDIGLTVDAEEAGRLELALDLIETVFTDPALGAWRGFGIAVQSYQRRGLAQVEWARDLALRGGRRMMVRLVKGAYWDAEIKLAQLQGDADYPVFTRKAATDLCYQACARRLLACRDTLYPQFATHNACTVAAILEMEGERSGYEFQRLHGMGELLFEQVVEAERVPCRIYGPVGVHSDLLAYLVRRLLENGSNSSFVNNILDAAIPVDALLQDPVAQVRAWREQSNPHLPRPPALYGPARRNAAGMDLGDPLALAPARAAMTRWEASLPLRYDCPGTPLVIRNPANREQVIGSAALADGAAMEAALQRAHGALPRWSATPVAERAALLRRLSDALEAHRDELLALCCREAGKTVADSVAEVREAVDFCRYYAAAAEAADFAAEGLQPLGVVLCISPWNFPLAIFLGQVSAALVTGNTVVAKPAEQACLIALRTLELLGECGMPDHVVELLVAEGPAAGARLVHDLRVRGVMFTGSTATGAWLARTLAQRPDAPVPLIAETGGQNCMVVDSTALPEQVADDVISSGFRSAGQRCSALRVLFLQEEIADRVIGMVSGAMRELRLGDPVLLSTDVGPVIDQRARARLEDHVRYLEGNGRLLCRCDEPAPGPHTFFAPRLYEISKLSLLEGEVFGPIVHVIRYRARDIHAVLEQINRTGYGLTFGMHSRIESAWQEAAQRVQAGNIYINRNMIGAIVGVQPFGGRGLSGTGPKAGGPHFLWRLQQPRAAAVRTGQRSLPAAADPPPGEACTAPAAMRAWAQSPPEHRIAVLRQFIAGVAAAASRPLPEATLHAAQAQLDSAAALLAQPEALPGPTGESDTLLLEPRGRLLMLLDTPAGGGHYLMALITALAGGNTVAAFAAEVLLDQWRALAACLESGGLPAQVFTVAPLTRAASALHAPGVGGAIAHPASPHLCAAARLLAEREGATGCGPILPLICDLSPRALLRRTLLEKTVSVDTTAAGGNAALMTMSA
jgi:RHH-type proline utilization regulon transcriptional repressor/proline dehydrogenase/delta 1-pyrroline-5-carboxylate dehydrogenase